MFLKAPPQQCEEGHKEVTPSAKVQNVNNKLWTKPK